MLRKRDWPVFFAGAMLLLTVLFFQWHRNTYELIYELLLNPPAGKFFYWSLYYHDFSWFVIPGATLFLIVLRAVRRRKKTTKVFLFTLMTMIVISIFICGRAYLILMSNLHEPVARHITTVQVDDAAHHVGVIADRLENRFLLYKCDHLGWMCEVAYSKLSLNSDTTSDKHELLVDFLDFRPRLQLLVNGETVYSYTPNR